MAACESCGQGLREGARFCGTCGQPVASGATGKAGPAKVSLGTAPAVAPPPPPPPPAAANTTSIVVTGIAVAVLVVAGILAVALVSTADDGEQDAAAAGEEAEAVSASETEDTSTLEPAAATSSTTTTSTAPPADGLPPGEWAAFLYAATSFGPAEAERSALSAFGRVQVLESTSYTTLKPGLYVVYVGGFRAPSGALDFCQAIGRNDRALCYARYLSRDPSVTWNVPGTDDARPEFVAYP